MIVDITNKKALLATLEKLNENNEAQWGLMRPQHMVEHLAATMKMSNGIKQMEQRFTDEQAKTTKATWIYTATELEKGLKTTTLPEVPGAFNYPTLDAAKVELMVQLDVFHNYFKTNPTATFIHPRMGHLDYKEWIIFHNKHFMHHFKQFSLV